MAQIHRLESDAIELKCSADKFYGFYKNNVFNLAKFLPETCKGYQVVEGDGKSIGSVRLWKHTIGDNPNIMVTKEKITGMDDESRSISFSIFEGDLMNFYSSLDFKLSVTPKGGSGGAAAAPQKCVVKWYLEFEKKDENVPPPNAMLDILSRNIQMLEAHLLRSAA